MLRLSSLIALLLALPLFAAPDPPVASEAITVTATRTPSRLGDTAASLVVLDETAIATSASPAIDDTLRQVPGFALFRRTGSRVANPTSQGVSLRGIGASGASRAVVLDDGIPLNDPFGGWVYWGRVTRASLQRVEVLRGGASDLYGSGAMGGVVNFLRKSGDATVVDLSAGSERTGSLSLFASRVRGGWNGTFAADVFSTAGYVLVDDGARGPVDVNADSRHDSFDASIARTFESSSRAFLRASYYRDSRENGTPLQDNDTTIRQLGAGADIQEGSGLILLRAYGSEQDYAQTFSAIAPDRTSERLTVDQSVPSRSLGGSAQWSRAIGLRQAVVAGAEGREVTGRSDEIQFSPTGVARPTSAGGRQITSSVFVEDVATISSRLSATASLRYDSWKDEDASRDGSPLADRSDAAWSPRLSALFRVTDALTLTGAAYRAFRAPTLNELYRSFRVGNVLTQANEDLGPERLSAIELGARTGPVRINVFSMTTDDTIANVTLASTPALITRQRQNLGSSRSRGVEVDAEWPFMGAWRFSAGGLLADSVVTSGTLSGKRLPQVAREQATAQLTRAASNGTLALLARWSDHQFDDDLNQLPLRSYVAFDLFASHQLSSSLAITASVENLFDHRIEASASPVITLGQPRAFRVGVRLGR